MNKSEVLELLEKHSDPRGKTHWEKAGNQTLNSSGIGLTVMKKLAKPIGKGDSLTFELTEKL